MTVAQGYVRVNGAWPETIPPLTFEEGRRATKLLWRAFVKRKFPWPIKESWGKYLGTWLRRRSWWISTHRGWKDMVHAVSHKANNRLCPNQKFHSGSHAFMEREMIEYVVSHGWLDGRLKSKAAPKPKPGAREKRHKSVVVRLAKWRSRLKRAQTAVKKLERQEAYYQRLA